MQSLPIPVTQTKALNLADVASKNGSPANKSSAENAKAAFQAELNKQVKAKQAQTQAKQDKNTESVKSSAQQSSSAKDSSEVDQTAQASKDSNSVSPDSSFLADLNKQLDAARDMANQASLSDAKNQSATVVTTGTENKEAIVTELISSLGIAPVQGLPNSANNGQVSAAADASGAVLTSTDAAMQQKNLMAAFSNVAASAQSQVQQPTTDINAKPQGESLADVLTAKPDMKATAEESAFGKTIANAAKDLLAKDLPVKDALPNTVQVQAASTNAPQNNSNVAAQQLASSNVINVYPGKTGWDQAISQKVVWMVGAGQQSASLTLNPPDLGPLKVVISVHNDQADTTFISDNDEVRKALESGMAHLRDKMSESGIQLGQANVSTSQQSQQEFQQAAQDRVFDGVKNQASTNVVENDNHAKVTVRVSDGLVDTFA
ncbi:flagellar hook-length control protein FliK [Methylotenera sp.]|uniref:flagellar hook-length control protein FliK n=1 Tax=Methylotenera sp. TaxID=2051956 RepID=UPI002ED8662A